MASKQLLQKRIIGWAACLTTSLVLGLAAAPQASADFYKTGWVADLPPGTHATDGIITIVDESTLQVEHFYYDGTAPAVYFYLGEDNTQQSFINGWEVPPMLDQEYVDASLTLSVPPPMTMADYNAISVWCAAFNANFTSASFAPVPCVGDANCDEVVNWRDIDYFVAAQNDNEAAWEDMFAPDPAGCPFSNNDINGDGTVNWRDIDPFVDLQNTTCP